MKQFQDDPFNATTNVTEGGVSQVLNGCGMSAGGGMKVGGEAVGGLTEGGVSGVMTEGGLIAGGVNAGGVHVGNQLDQWVRMTQESTNKLVGQLEQTAETSKKD